MDDGNLKVWWVEKEEGIGNFEGVVKDKVMEEIVFALPIIEGET